MADRWTSDCRPAYAIHLRYEILLPCSLVIILGGQSGKCSPQHAAALGRPKVAAAKQAQRPLPGTDRKNTRTAQELSLGAGRALLQANAAKS